MKTLLAILIAALILITAFGSIPPSRAPIETNVGITHQSLDASILAATNQTHRDIPTDVIPRQTVSSQTQTLLSLLEQTVDEEHDLNKGSELIEQSENSPDNSKIIELYRAKILSRSLNFEQAQKLLDRVDPNELPILKAAVLIAQDNRNKTLSYLHSLVDSHPDAQVKITALAFLNIYHTYDTYRDADESYLWTLFAQKIGELGEPEISLYLAKKAVERNELYRDAWIIKGYNEFSLNHPEEAELSLLRAYELDPGNPHIQYLLGLTYHELNKPELSNQYLLYAQQNTREYDSIISSTLAENSIDLEDYPLAAYYYERLLELKTDQKKGLSGLVWLYTEHLNQLDKALLYAEHLTRQYRDDPNSFHLLSWVYSKRGELEKAENELQKAQSLEEGG
ncbi:MAG: hypothetical protein U1C97_00335 [Candidatus Gracilibacteria bacterium]|nr:hypothetical protein [bacterium]MDZ4216748.1 hypothetical protein [Candidatus Gracilibacteria bacterium]